MKMVNNNESINECLNHSTGSPLSQKFSSFSDSLPISSVLIAVYNFCFFLNFNHQHPCRSSLRSVCRYLPFYLYSSADWYALKRIVFASVLLFEHSTKEFFLRVLILKLSHLTFYPSIRFLAYVARVPRNKPVYFLLISFS